MAEGIEPNYLDKSTFDKAYKKTSDNFTSWTFTVTQNTGMGILCGFSEVWAFQWNPSRNECIYSRIIKITNDTDRGFVFTYNSDNTITVTTTATVWGGAFVVLQS